MTGKMWYQEWQRKRSYDILHKETILSEWRTEITPTQATKNTEEPAKGRFCYVTSVLHWRAPVQYTAICRNCHMGERIHWDHNSFDHEWLLLIPETLHCYLWFLGVQVGNRRKGQRKWKAMSMWRTFTWNWCPEPQLTNTGRRAPGKGQTTARSREHMRGEDLTPW